MDFAMDVTVVIFAGALFVYALYLNIMAPRNAKKALEAEKINQK